MRFTSFQADNFLSFDEFEFTCLEQDLNIIVGPNSGGKTNFVRAIEMICDVLSAGRGNSRDRELWYQSEKVGSSRRGFSVQLGLQMSSKWEQDLLSAFVGASLAVPGPLLASSGQKAETPGGRMKYYQWIQNQVTPDKFESLYNGELVVKFSGKPENRWDVSYVFQHEGQRYVWILEGLARLRGLANLASVDSERTQSKQLAIALGQFVKRDLATGHLNG